MADMTFLTRFLPNAVPLQRDSWQLDDTTSLITLHVASTQRKVPCPVCAMRVYRLHSHYERLLANLPEVPPASDGSSASASFSAAISSAPAVSSRNGFLGGGAMGSADTANGRVVERHRSGPRRSGGHTPEPTLRPHG